MTDTTAATLSDIAKRLSSLQPEWEERMHAMARIRELLDSSGDDVTAFACIAKPLSVQVSGIQKFAPREPASGRPVISACARSIWA